MGEGVVEGIESVLTGYCERERFARVPLPHFDTRAVV